MHNSELLLMVQRGMQEQEEVRRGWGWDMQQACALLACEVAQLKLLLLRSTLHHS